MSRFAVGGNMNATINDSGLTGGTTASYRVVARINPSQPAGNTAAPASGATLSFTGKVEIVS